MASLIEGKNRLPALIHEAENDEPMFIPRRGKPVAVLLSLEISTRLTQKRFRLFTQAYDHFQKFGGIAVENWIAG